MEQILKYLYFITYPIFFSSCHPLNSVQILNLYV